MSGPIVSGQEVTYTNTLYVSPAYPQVKYCMYYYIILHILLHYYYMLFRCNEHDMISDTSFILKPKIYLNFFFLNTEFHYLDQNIST